ncbi:hypothetical protein PsorP6_002262 [Peronosclerospora sorghi]|uniref:Uncharacterized protein n=1 Tax=Peronosclerospora sorghi TaxID=230839 RepID=A0ACC0WV74_9STRA|nr:hypothetical protein PsorP6_002262 [Peronosclerospora sorghi]
MCFLKGTWELVGNYSQEKAKYLQEAAAVAHPHHYHRWNHGHTMITSSSTAPSTTSSARPHIDSQQQQMQMKMQQQRQQQYNNQMMMNQQNGQPLQFAGQSYQQQMHASQISAAIRWWSANKCCWNINGRSARSGLSPANFFLRRRVCASKSYDDATP